MIQIMLDAPILGIWPTNMSGLWLNCGFGQDLDTQKWDFVKHGQLTDTL